MNRVQEELDSGVASSDNEVMVKRNRTTSSDDQDDKRWSSYFLCIRLNSFCSSNVKLINLFQIQPKEFSLSLTKEE